MIHCPGCGMGLRFDIESQQMRCDYCGASHDPYRFDSAKDDAKNAEFFEARVWVCPSCGAELETTDDTDAVGFCPYCGGASLLYDRIREQWRPDYVIPFSVTKEECKKAYLAEAKRHRYVSKKYKDPALLESFRGLYMPYWYYRVRHEGEYKVAFESVKVREGDYLVSHVYQVSGAIDMELDDLAHDASTAFDDRISEDLAPYMPEGKKPFAPGFLSGFYTVIGDRPQQALEPMVEEYAKNSTLHSLCSSDNEVGQAIRKKGGTLLPEESFLPTQVVSADRVLVPVWFMSYRQGKNVTYAAVNGQTGKVSADLPASPGKLARLALRISVALFIVIALLPSIQAGNAAFITAAVFAVGSLLLRRSYKNMIGNHKELEFSAEGVKYKRFDAARAVVVILALIVGSWMMVTKPASNFGPYCFCIAAAVVFFLYLFHFIRFQLSVAKRRPPQMNRKGAASDEK